MPTFLTQRTFRVFAVLENYRAGSPDILDALLPFFEPILNELDAQVLNQADFADLVKQAYRWNFTSDIVEELIPRFQRQGWVKEIARSNEEVIYHVTCPSSQNSAPSEGLRIAQVLANATDQFKTFIEKISPLTHVSLTTNELADTLVEWLVSIDAYSEDVLRQKATLAADTQGKLGVYVNLPDTSQLTSEQRYLCARFVKKLFDDKSPLISDLCKLASVGLLTEVIQDFQKPITKVTKTNLSLYLDAPVALDLLGVSGKEAAANIRPIISELQSIGATIRIFRISILELQRALDAVLKRTPVDRTGPTAEALRRNEVAEAYVRQVATDPVGMLAKFDVQPVERKLTQYPNEHEFFPQAEYDELFSKMRWQVEIPPREHDATVLALIMRMRAGSYSRDLFQTRHLMVTRNGTLAQLGQKFCRDRDLAPPNSVGPAIHQRQLATAAWLRTGLSDDRESVPRRYLLSACERVLELKKGVVDQVRTTARALTKEKAEQLELLLQEDRSVQVLMDKTLGASTVVNANNIDSIIDVMKKGLTADIEQAASDKISATERAANSKVRKAHEARRSAERQLSEMSASLAQSELEDQKMVAALVQDANRKLRLFRTLQKLICALILVVIGSLPLLSDNLDGHWKIAALLITGGFAVIFAFFQLLDKPVGLERRAEAWGRRKLDQLALERSMEEKLNKVTIEYQQRELAAKWPWPDRII